MFNPSTGSTLACIQGPKVDISKAGNPQLVFWYYAYPGTDGKITVKVNRNGQEMKEVGTVDYNKLSGSMGWRSVSFDLAGVSNAGVENGYIRPYFYAEGLSTSLLIDNIKIYDAVDNNLSAELDAPAHVQNGKVTVVNVKVTNLGTAKASGYKVHLYVDGKRYETEEGEYLEPNAQATYSSMNVDGAVVKDDFETYTPWSINNVGDWTLYDGDKGTVYTFGGIQHPNSGVAQAYIVFNPWQVSGLAADYMQMFAKIFAPHSGEQSMMSTGTTIDTGTPTNNWLITPELSGKEQTVSFWVNDPGDEVSRGEQNPNSGPETFVHTSTGSLTSYNYEPDRVCVDDVTYRAGGLRVMGYNVYRDGVLVKKLDSKTTTWTDDNYANDNGYGAGNHKYNVIVVYANGESDVSNTAYVGDPAAGIGLVTVEGAKADNRVYTVDGQYVGNSLQNLNKGLYIQNGKKVVVK